MAASGELIARQRAAASNDAAEARYSFHQAKYFAHWLTLRSRMEDSVSKTLATARVDMNPHQVEAALFALRSPVSSGVLLADEVGLGKTIEAALVIAQCWAEQKRNLLLIVPATLRKQWQQELLEKFGLPSVILESKSYNEARKAGSTNPFLQHDQLVISSYEFAAAKKSDVAAVAWNLVVLDEAHKLRNLHKGETAKRAWALNEALRNRRKVMLTATPFQNSLLELYGLVSFISDDHFGSKEAFQLQYTGTRVPEIRLLELKKRLKPICKRTLRRQVQQEGGINFTRRFSITQDFTPTDDELTLYNAVSDYLRDPSILAIKPRARHLVTLVIRKILASSPQAIAETLATISDRLQKRQAMTQAALQDFDTVDELADESEVDEDVEPLQGELLGLQTEITQLSGYKLLAESIKVSRKAEALLQVLEKAFAMTERLGGARKAVIFTESCRTQMFIRDLLHENGYAGRVVLLNGSNSDADSKAVYEQWKQRHQQSAIVSGSKTADMKAAVVEEFRDRRDILISTEAGGEGINLQFCSLLINYDLPWNPQRVEQRIGRVHRYGQKSDVVVVNFVNRKNRADELVFELLDKKFKLFDGVFGASDQILGALESGVDIEQRINRIYQECRDRPTIETEFEKLRQDLDVLIAERESVAQRSLMENFDEDVVRVLRTRRKSVGEQFTLYQKQFMRLVQAQRPDALIERNIVKLAEGRFAVTWPIAESEEAQLLDTTKDLGAALCNQAKESNTPVGMIEFRYGQMNGQLSDVREYINSTGTLQVGIVSIRTARENIERMIFSAVTADGRVLSSATAERLLHVSGSFTAQDIPASDDTENSLKTELEKTLGEAHKLNEQWFAEETERLDRWAEDQRILLKQTVDNLDAQIKESRRVLRQVVTLEEKIEIEKLIKRMKRERDEATLRFYEDRKRIADEEDAMLVKIEESLKMSHDVRVLFTVAWTLKE